MQSMNEFKIVGKVTTKVHMKYSAAQTARAWYTVETQTTKTVRGETKTFKNIVPIQTFGRQAEDDQRTLAVGAVVEILGSINTWSEKQDNGSYKNGINIVGEEVRILSGGQGIPKDEAQAWVKSYVENEKAA